MASDAKSKKNPAAVALGWLGGLRGGPARAKRLTAVWRERCVKSVTRFMFSFWGSDLNGA
jgi:hypothetical protein